MFWQQIKCDIHLIAHLCFIPIGFIEVDFESVRLVQLRNGNDRRRIHLLSDIEVERRDYSANRRDQVGCLERRFGIFKSQLSLVKS